jgi:GTP-binding protein HflX
MDTISAETGRAAIVVLPDLKSGSSNADDSRHGERERAARDMEVRRFEAVGLAQAIGLDVREAPAINVRRAAPATLIGKGKVEDLAALVRIHDAELVIFDHALSPVQQRNLETALGTKVLDRTGLILEIFGERAQTSEGRLQVELAHLNYQKGRLVRSWTHLERQRGGFGFLGGPGETQIEADRRQIQGRIKQIEKALAGVTNMRAVHRAKRKRVPQPVAALVGYTNAGKSTLFNRLTGADIFAEDMLFATLDPTLRRVKMPHGEDIILSDTVGFISDLPTTLVAAFRATLEEVLEADLILHVRDIASPETDAQAEDVIQVLGELGIPPGDERIIEVWNKTDLLDDDQRDALALRAERTKTKTVPVSAVSGQGVDDLLAVIEARLMETRSVFKVSFQPELAHHMAWLFERTEVLDRRDDQKTGIVRMVVRVPEKRLVAFHDWAQEVGVEPQLASL